MDHLRNIIMEHQKINYGYLNVTRNWIYRESLETFIAVKIYNGPQYINQKSSI